METYVLKEKASPIAKGQAVGAKIGQGVTRILRNVSQIHDFRAGEVLVTDMTDPDWEPIMKTAGAIVTNRGGRTRHAPSSAASWASPASSVPRTAPRRSATARWSR